MIKQKSKNKNKKSSRKSGNRKEKNQRNLDGNGYDIKKSRISDDRLAEFVMSPLQSDLKSVPGISPLGVEKLNKIGILNTYNLIGAFLLMKEENQTSQEHADAMYMFLKNAGLVQYLSGIVTCIGEKADTMIPGLWSADELRES